jgi:hypothetical protein
MTKLTFDYDSPENNAKVLEAYTKLPPHIGKHIKDKRQRTLFREGYAAAQAFDLEVWRDQKNNRLRFRGDGPKVACMVRSASLPPDDPKVAFFVGVMAGSRGIEKAMDDRPDMIERMQALEGTRETMTRLIYDYDSQHNNDTVALYLQHPEVANKGKHIGPRLRPFYLEGYAAAKGFGIRVHMGSRAIGFAMAPTDARPSIFDKFHRPNEWNKQLKVFFAGLIEGAEQATDEEFNAVIESGVPLGRDVAAKQLASYMQFRATRENSKSTLDEAFFRNAIKVGTTSFFGITFNANTGQLTGDKQNPAAFVAWQAKEKFRTEHPLAAD